MKPATRTFCTVLAALSLGAAAARSQEAPPAPRPPVHEEVSTPRLMGALRELPPARSAAGDAEGEFGLMRTESLIEQRLRQLGYEPERFALWWNARREQRRAEHQRQAERAARGEGPPPEGDPPPLSGEPGEEADALVWHNLIVEIPGRTKPNEVILVGAHFDAVAGSPGADDNGTGVAALLELAAVLRGRPMERTVRLAFFNLEEVGLKGSIEYASTLRERLADPDENPIPPGKERLVGMLSLEMLGYFTDEPGSQRSPVPPIKGVFEPPTEGDFIALVTTRPGSAWARRLDAAVRRASPDVKTLVADFFPPGPLTPLDVLRSDHAPFMALGVPAVMVTDTANFRNPNYHRATDTPETIDADRFAAVVRGLAGAIHELAGPLPDEPAGPIGPAPDSSPPAGAKLDLDPE